MAGSVLLPLLLPPVLGNRAFAAGFVLLLIRESAEEEIKAAERDLPHHLPWRHTGRTITWPTVYCCSTQCCLLESATDLNRGELDRLYYRFVIISVLTLRFVLWIHKSAQSLFFSRFFCVYGRKRSHMGDQGKITCIFHMVCEKRRCSGSSAGVMLLLMAYSVCQA